MGKQKKSGAGRHHHQIKVKVMLIGVLRMFLKFHDVEGPSSNHAFRMRCSHQSSKPTACHHQRVPCTTSLQQVSLSFLGAEHLLSSLLQKKQAFKCIFQMFLTSLSVKFPFRGHASIVLACHQRDPCGIQHKKELQMPVHEYHILTHCTHPI